MTVSQQSKAEPPMHKLHRDEYAMSAEQVAQILGISRQRVAQIERGAGGAAEFQRAFDEAKIIAARKGEEE